jgi:putative DNA primase/helicase
MKTIDAAAGRWRSIFQEFGVAPADLCGKHRACPNSGEGVDRFRFSDQNGSGNFFCACSPDGRKGGMGFLMCRTGRTFPDLAAEVDKIIGNVKDKGEKPDRRDPLPLLRDIQRRAQPSGIAVDGYLFARGLTPTPAVRQVSGLEYWEDGRLSGRFDAMVCRIVDAKGVPQSYHVTYISGQFKAPVSVPRKVLPPASGIAGCAVRLFPVAEHIGIAEGIETALAASMIFRMPVWACISRGGLESFVPPLGVSEVTVYGDNDASFAGQAGAYKAAECLKRKKIRASVRIPEQTGTDWNDQLRGEKSYTPAETDYAKARE